MLTAFGAGATLVFITFLALRQAATPAPLLGRMTSTMRWLILLPAAPGVPLVAIAAWRQPIIRNLRTLPMASGAHRAADGQLVPDSQPGEFVP